MRFKVSDSLALPDLKHEDYNDIFNVRPSDFVQLSSHAQHKWHRDGRDCFGQFNPDNQEASLASRDGTFCWRA